MNNDGVAKATIATDIYITFLVWHKSKHKHLPLSHLLAEMESSSHTEPFKNRTVMRNMSVHDQMCCLHELMITRQHWHRILHRTAIDPANRDGRFICSAT